MTRMLQTSQSHSKEVQVESHESAVSSWEIDPSEVIAVASGGGVGGGAAPIVVSHCVATPSLVVR
jgi:hypothetical protein